ncbi:MAG: hypothetical protein ACRDWY_10685, partial [Actinomycetes bacterium]
MSRWSRRTSRRRNSRTASVGVACAAACLAVLGLGGCAEDRLGAAAVVEGRTISTDDLQSATRAHLDLVPGGDAGQAQLAILQRRIVSEVIDEVARDLDVHIRQARVAAERDEVLQSVGGRKGLVRSLAQGQQPTALDPGAVDRWMRDQLLFEKIAAELCDCELAPQSAEAQ